MLKLLSRVSFTGILLTLAACNAPLVERESEVNRFTGDLTSRTSALDIKPDAVLSMSECEKIALSNSLDIAVKRQELRLEDERVRLAISAWFPTADLYYSNQLRSNENAVKQGGNTFPASGKHEQNLTINATIPIFDFGVTYYGWKIALDKKQQKNLIFKRTQQQLARDVRIAYARHASEIRQLTLAQTNVKAAEEVLRVAEAQQREGLSTSAETAVVRATLSEAKVEESNVRRRISETRMTLMTLMSLPPRMPIAIDDKLPAMPQPPSAELVEIYENHALRVRPELYQQDLERHINANDIRREFASFFPKIDGIASFNWTNNIFMANPAYMLGGMQVAQALLDAPTRMVRLEAANVIADVERDRTLLLSLGVLYDVDLRAIQLHRGNETISSLVTQEAARKEAFERVLSLYKEGLENEAATAQALANLSLQTMDLDKARTDYQVWWYEFETAALPQEADASGAKAPFATTAPAETQPVTLPATQPATTQAK